MNSSANQAYESGQVAAYSCSMQNCLLPGAAANFLGNVIFAAVVLIGLQCINTSGTFAQTPIPNPDLVSACPYNIIFVLDESASIVNSSNGSIVSQVRSGARNLISALSGTGSKVVVVEFNSEARAAVIGGATGYQTINSGYVTTFNNYVNADGNNTPGSNNYDPEDYQCRSGQCYTNWESAFNQVQNINNTLGLADLVIFFTDGMPTAYTENNGTVIYGSSAAITAQALAEATVAANAVKTQGSHIFVVGIPNPTLPESNIWQISGPDKYPVPENDFTKGDYSVSNSSTLQQDLARIANAVCIVDLRLVKTASVPSACAGDAVTFTLTLFNEGIDRASGIVVQDILPSGFAYLNDDGGNTTTEAGGTVIWNISELNPGASVSLQINTTANASGSHRNTAQVAACPQTDVDSSPANDDGDQSEDDEAYATVVISSLQSCNDGDPCSIDQCDNGQCVYTFLNCDDNNPCTADQCSGDTCMHVLTSYNTSASVTICANESYYAGGALQNTAGTFADTFSATSGCDSIHTTYLTVLPVYRNFTRVPICQGDSLFLGGYYRKQAGVYHDTFTAQNGCDSIFSTAVVIPNCSDYDLCTDDFCISGICSNVPISCDDQNSCTSDSCINEVCVNILLDCGAAISGYVLTETGIGIPNATVYLTGDLTDTAITRADGYYAFNVMQGGSYVIAPAKNNDVVIANGVTTLDIAMINRHILSVQPLTTPYKIIAADVNGSGSVTSIDAAIMTGFVIGNIPTFPNGILWQFASSDYVFPDPQHPSPFDHTRVYSSVSQSYTNQNFIGVKVGDVNDSWDPSVP